MTGLRQALDWLLSASAVAVVRLLAAWDTVVMNLSGKEAW